MLPTMAACEIITDNTLQLKVAGEGITAKVGWATVTNNNLHMKVAW